MDRYGSFQEMAQGTGALQQGGAMSVFNADDGGRTTFGELMSLVRKVEAGNRAPETFARISELSNMLKEAAGGQVPLDALEY